MKRMNRILELEQARLYAVRADVDLVYGFGSQKGSVLTY